MMCCVFVLLLRFTFTFTGCFSSWKRTLRPTWCQTQGSWSSVLLWNFCNFHVFTLLVPAFLPGAEFFLLLVAAATVQVPLACFSSGEVQIHILVQNHNHMY